MDKASPAHNRSNGGGAVAAPVLGLAMLPSAGVLSPLDFSINFVLFGIRSITNKSILLSILTPLVFTHTYVSL